MEGVGILNASSYSGGVEFLGIIPGSLPEVNKRNKKSCTREFILNISLAFKRERCSNHKRQGKNKMKRISHRLELD
jgi:hypothetical protein